MSSGPNPFWLCHEVSISTLTSDLACADATKCGAQMRPIKVNSYELCIRDSL